jgi:hypothetical protein
VSDVNFGDVLLARLPFHDGGGFKLRPVLVIHEHGDGDLLVVPVTTHDPRAAGDTPITLWQEAEQSGGRVFTISANSWLTGQPNRIAAFRRALEIILSHPGVWPTTYGALLDTYQAQE